MALLGPLSYSKDFHIDPSAPLGADSADGSLATPWKTLAPANRQAFKPRDRLLLAGGQVIPGTLTLGADDAGTQSTPVVVTSYGTGLAEIAGGAGAGILITNTHDLELRQLKVTGLGRKTGNTADGVSVSGSNHLMIDGLDISGFQHNGLGFTSCSHVRVLRVNAHDNGKAGIMANAPAWNDPAQYMPDWYFGYCRTDNNPGDPTYTENHSGNGLFLGQVSDALIEYCEASNNGWDMPNTNVNGPAGIWAWQSDRVTIQYCISHDNHTPAGKVDGDGFDFDGGVRDSVMQYCLSYRNDGPGFLLYESSWATAWSGNTVRYCISADDGVTNGSAGMIVWHDSGSMNGADVYNNTIYNSHTDGKAIWFAHALPNGRFANNLFVTAGAPFLEGGAHAPLLLNNFYAHPWGAFSMDGFDTLAGWAAHYGKESLDGRFLGVSGDPLLVSAGVPAGLEDPETLVYSPAFSLGSGSPCAGNGLDLAKTWGLDTGTRDLSGQPLDPSGPPSIGAMLGTPPLKRRLSNVSTRAVIGPGEKALIGGFVITGSSPKSVLIRAAGPALAPFLGSANLLADPALSLHTTLNGADAVVALNDNWSANATEARDILEATERTGAFGWELGSRDAALVATLSPGAYTAVVESASGGTGLGLVEVYELGVDRASTRLVNLSTRAAVHVGDGAEIAGFVISSATPKQVLIRASGPSLSPFLAPETLLANPVLSLYHASPAGNELVAANDEWSGDASEGSQIADAAAKAHAFPWTDGSHDAALLLTLPEGNYTAVVSGKAGAEGVALVEVYEVD